MQTPIASFTSLIGILVLIYSLVAYVRSYWKLRHVPGPRLAAWSNIWWIKAAVSGKSHLRLHDVCAKYGPLVRIAPNKLVTSDSEFFRRINTNRTSYTKADWYKAFRFDASFENLFSETDNVKHAEMRKKVGMGYSGKENPNLEADINKVLFKLIDLIASKYISDKQTTKPMDYGQTIHYYTLDVITTLSLGEAFGYLDEVDKYAYITTIEASMPAMNLISAVPFLLKLITSPAIQNAALPSMKDRIGMGAIKGAAHDIIAKRFLPGDQKVRKSDMCQSFVDRGMTQVEIADEALLQILAGSDTTALTLRTLMTCVSSNAQISRRLQQEIDAADVPIGEIISYTRALQLPYLRACVKEALRYYPVFTGLTPRKVGPEGDHYEGIYLPPGTEIGVSAWSTSRRNDAYGPDSAFFRPERWLATDPDRVMKMDREAELLFMHGAYQCMGERIAMIELHKTCFELMRRFEFSLLNPMQPLQKEECYGLMIQKGLMVRVETRFGAVSS